MDSVEVDRQNNVAEYGLPSEDNCNGEDVESVDYENNGLLWLPPEPEDEEDERGALLSDDGGGEGEGEGATGVRGDLSSSSCSASVGHVDVEGQHNKVSCGSHAEGTKFPSNSEILELESSEQCLPSSPDPQSISVSLSTHCMWKGTVCERDHLLHIKYYGSFDMPLGLFLREHLFDQGYRCNSCEMPSEAHVRCYSHRQGSLTVSVKKLSEIFLPGEREGRIWTWHRCLSCPRTNVFPPASKRVLMSDAAFGQSFGNFLALSFSTHDAASRIASCGHSLHRECLRFYGFGRMVACFRYAPISVYSFYLPPANVVFNYDKQEWIQNEADEVSSRADLFFAEVLNVLRQISDKNSTDSKSPVSRQQIAELQVMLQKEKEEFEELLKQVLNGEIELGQPAVDILKINRLRRQLVFNSYVWLQRLSHVTSSTHFSTNTSNQSDNLNYGEAVQQAQSEKFQAMENQLNSLDAVWTCDYQLTSVAFSNPLPGGLPTGTRLTTADSGVGNCTNDQSLAEKHNDDSSSSSGMSFSTFYRLLNKVFSTNSLKCSKIIEYDPVFSSLRTLVHQSEAGLLLPVASTNIVVPVYEDEPTSIISYALVSPEYLTLMSSEINLLPFHSLDEVASESRESLLSNYGSRCLSSLDPLLYTNVLHARVSFLDDDPSVKLKYTVICYYAKQFEALRKTCCPSKLDFIQSLSRCKKWGAQGGKSNVFFAKTLDDRFIIKQVTKADLKSFIKFAPAYFKYLSESINARTPTCLAKILGIYQVTLKHLEGGKESRMDVLVIENLLFKRNITRLYDLKGSYRSRYNPDTGGSNKVLLDQNLIEEMATSPVFVGTQSKRLLQRAIWNDTSFLSSINVTDYSLLVGLDEEKHELVIGIINFMRQYTWDKHLETWIKKYLCMSPAVISPVQYKKRFRHAMSSYFPSLPDQ